MKKNTVQEWLGEHNKVGHDIWEKKYRYNGESFDQWLDRVSGGDATLREQIEEKKFLFGGRILANRGLSKYGKKITYSNCYVIAPPEDNLESIFDTATKLARTYSYGGGCGIDLGKLRPKGFKVNNAANSTSGAVSFMELYNTTTGLIGQEGRRGALMISLPVNHPDIEEFITIKNNDAAITKANISLRVTHAFMEAARNGEMFPLEFEGEVVGEVDAKALFYKMAENNYNWAEPGMLYWDNITNYNMLEHFENFEFAGVNPCASL